MNRNRLASLIILASALGFSACGGVSESSGGDTKAANAPAAVNAAAPVPTAGGGAPTAATNADAARPNTSPAAESRASANAPAAKAPKPQIGSGGNDLFLFTQARAAVDSDADLKAANVVIEVKEGVVTLNGSVASAALKSKAEELARGAGAKDVKNQLRVSAGR